MGFAMALVETGLDVPAQEHIRLDFIPFDQIDDLAPSSITTGRTSDFDFPPSVDYHTGPSIRQRLHTHLGLADRAEIRQVGRVPEHDVQFIEDLELLESTVRGVLAFVKDRIRSVDRDSEDGRDGCDVDGFRV